MQQVPLVREQFVLAGRALMTLTDADAGHDVPVMLSPFLGSGSTLRGISATAALRIATACCSPASIAGGRRATSTWRSSWTPDKWPPSGGNSR